VAVNSEVLGLAPGPLDGFFTTYIHMASLFAIMRFLSICVILVRQRFMADDAKRTCKKGSRHAKVEKGLYICM
jgi:hypothetical protein